MWSIVCVVTVTLIFMQCDPNGRPDNEQQLLFINPDVSVEQIGDDPILILENDVYVAVYQSI